MYDTAHLFLPTERAGGVDLPAYLPVFLERVTEHFHANDSTSVSGYLNNLRVRASGAGLSVKGSLCKYYLTNNFGSLTRQDTQRAIEQLSDALELPMSRANVTRIDISKTMLTKHPPKAYYALLGFCKPYTRISQPDTVYYQHGIRTLCFYDKILESRSDKVVIPEIWIDKNALRYEARYMKRLPKQFNRSEVTAADLYKEEFYISLIDRWVKEFETIPKVHLVDINLEQAMKSISDFRRIAQLRLVEELGGQVAAFELIEQNNLKGAYNHRNYPKRFREHIMELSKESLGKLDQTETSFDLMKELSSKVKQAQQFYR